jgi:DNA polymerase-3 subunit epsilon
MHDLHLVVLAASEEELKAHAEQLERIERESKGKCLWMRLESLETVEIQSGEGSDILSISCSSLDFI